VTAEHERSETIRALSSQAWIGWSSVLCIAVVALSLVIDHLPTDGLMALLAWPLVYILCSLGYGATAAKLDEIASTQRRIEDIRNELESAGIALFRMGGTIGMTRKEQKVHSKLSQSRYDLELELHAAMRRDAATQQRPTTPAERPPLGSD
jgi:hypothetical protein